MALTVDEVRDHIAAFCRLYPGAAQIAYRVRETQEEAFSNDEATIENAGRILGGYFPRRGYAAFAASNLRDHGALQLALRHEILGHFGLNTFRAQEKRALLNALIAARHEPSLAEHWRFADEHYGDRPAFIRAEEVYAFACEAIEPHQRGLTAAGERSFHETCIARQRSMRLDDLTNITLMVAEGLRDRSRSQAIFPQSDHEQFRKEPSMADRKPYRERVAETMLELIENGAAPWQKPWKAGLMRVGPHNAESGRPYRGMNALWLEAQGHEDPRWLTYRQAQAADAKVRRGEQGTSIEFWKWSETRPVLDADGNPRKGEDGKPLTERVRLARPSVFYATVFNAEQIDGLGPWHAPEAGFEPAEQAERILAGGGVAIRHSENDRAFYLPFRDTIHLPDRAAFSDAYEYYATALHELGHATGHKSRLDRAFGVFGSEGYAREELRAEMASYMVTSELGLGHYPERHAAYLDSWLKALKEEPRALFVAAREAEAIRAWIVEPERRQELEKAARSEREAELAPDQPRRAEHRPDQALDPEGSRMTEDDMKKRIMLYVPFEEKDEAKALGARWDRKAKSWYVHEGVDLAPFAGWTAPPGRQEQKAAPALSPQEEFAEALRANGMELDGPPVMNGEWQRVSVEGDRKGQKSGSYRGFLDGHPAGQIMNYRSGEKAVQWVATGDRMSEDELARLKEDAERHRKAREAARAAQWEKIADIAQAVLETAPKASPDHAYCKAKGMGDVTGLRLVPDNVTERAAALGVLIARNPREAKGMREESPDAAVLISGDLIVPMHDTRGRVWNLQTIREDGTKLFLKGGRKSGLMHRIGDEGGPLLITEGYATAASLRDATGLSVAVAFDAGNLAEVAAALRAEAPERPLTIAADDDHAKKQNAGLRGAERAAQIAGCSVIAPPFTQQEKAKNLTDFNDLEKTRGREAFAAAVAALLREAHSRAQEIRPSLENEVRDDKTVVHPATSPRKKRDDLAPALA